MGVLQLQVTRHEGKFEEEYQLIRIENSNKYGLRMLTRSWSHHLVMDFVKSPPTRPRK
jgi:hypothetical protein